MKIALLTPYTGGNLGDSAIQEAVIDNIRKRHPDADICLITLCPEATTRVHGLSSFPINSLLNNSPVRSIAKQVEDNVNPTTGTECRLLNRIKAGAKRSPFLYSRLKWLYQRLTWFGKGPRLIVKEVIHLVRAYRLLKGVRLVLVSGGGQLDDYWGGAWAHPYALFKWGFIAKAVGAKYAFLSVGTCTLESKLSVFFIRQALRMADYRSYRDHDSKMLLRHITITCKDAVYPDLAFSYGLRSAVRTSHKTESGRVVAVSPIAYLSRYAWPRKDVLLYERYFDELIAFIYKLVSQGYFVVLFSTDTPDRHVVSDLVIRLYENGEPKIRRRIRRADPDTIEDLHRELVNVDYVVASRLHGVLLSHLLALPVLAISYDRKVDTYMRDMEMADYCLDIHRLEATSLFNAFQELTINQDKIKMRLTQKKKDYARALEKQYDFVLNQ